MEHLAGLIKDLALILMVAAIVTLLFKKLKQPLILGYILAGFVVGPGLSLTPTVTGTDNIEVLAQIGVIFLLFSLGLDFSFRKLFRMGGVDSVTALVKITITAITGYYVGRWMGWSFTDSLFLGGMLAGSSTIIVIKTLDDLGLRTRQFADVAVGVLIIEDIVVVLLMVLLSTIAVTRQFAGGEMLFTLGKLLFFLGLWIITGIFLIPTFLRRIKKLLDNETLLVLAVGLCLGMVVLAVSSGFSAELGAFIMGSILAETTKAEKIQKIFIPVRDLFGAIFFVSVGMLIDPKTIIEFKWAILIVTVVTLVVKIGSTFIGAIVSGQPMKQSVQLSMSMAQIGEFAFIVAALGTSLRVTSKFLFPVAVGVASITTFTTPFLIKFSEPLFNFMDRHMPEFIKIRLENYAASTQNMQAESKWKIVLTGYLKIMATNGIILLAVLLLSVQALLPFLNQAIGNNVLSSLLTLVITLAVAMPFLWAFMVRRPESIAYKELWVQEKYSKGPLLAWEIMRVILGIIILGFWIDRLFTTTLGGIVSLPLIVVVLFLFSKRIKKFYKKIETRFLDNLNQREIASEMARPSWLSNEPGMNKWDAHMVDLEVSPQALFIGRHLIELSWREKFGINIAYIKRGDNVIYAPTRNDRLLPYDHIGVIATDEQLNVFVKEFERVEISDTEERDLNNIVLYKMVVDEKNKLKGQSIRSSEIREKTNGLVVGIERKTQRILNPESDTIFEWGDIIWVVGERSKINSINRPLDVTN